MTNKQLLPYLLLSIAAAPCVQAANDTPVVEWMRTNAIRIATPEAGHGFADMQKLKQVVGDARIVSLGEATHGTREFFQLKHRMRCCLWKRPRLRERTPPLSSKSGR